jgi:hypothetical protein
MRTRLRARALALGGSLLAATLLVTACENPADPDAARVGDADISSESLLDTADVYVGLPGDPYQLAADTEHAYASTGLAAILSERIADEIILGQAERYGLEPDPALVEQISPQFSALDALPEDQKQAFLETRALEQQLFQYVATNQWWNEDEAAIFDELVAGSDSNPPLNCVHHILVDTEEEGDDIVAELEDGGSFEEIAADRSTDTNSGQAGGELGCNPAGSFVAPFEAAIQDAEPGDVVGPVETEFGFHVIRVDTIETAGASAWLEVLRRTTKVHVDPRYGSWDASSFSVIPPEGAVAPAESGLDFSL